MGTTVNLNELTLDNVGSWPPVLRYGMAFSLSLLIIAFGYWFFISPNYDRYNTLLNQESTLKVDFERKQQQAVNLQAYRNQYEIMRESFGNMLKQLPAQNEMPGLLEDISKTGIASGLTFDLFAPMPEVIHDFYVELPINIVVVGNYHQLAVFLSRIAEMSRIVTLHDFEIAPASRDIKGTSKAKSDALVMKITAKIYRYRIL